MDVVWDWKSDCENALKEVKRKITQPPVLTFYDQKADLTLQVGSSKDGLGAALLQNDQPIEYSSRALIKTERNCALIEKELLLVLNDLTNYVRPEGHHPQ